MDVLPEAEVWAESELAEGTQRLYRHRLSMVERWLDGRELTDETCSAYVKARFEDGVSPSYLAQSVAAVRWSYRARGLDHPCGPDTVRALKRAKRQGRGRGVGQVRGLTFGELTRMAELAAGCGKLFGLRDAACLRVGWDGLLRVGELANVQVDHVSFEPDGSGRLLIPHSKTDQQGRGRVQYLGPPTVAAIEAWMDASAIEDSYLWRRVTRQGTIPRNEPVHTQTLREIIQTWAAAAGIEGRISGHSLRVGAAQELARRGAAVPLLMAAGRWASPDMVARYTRHIDAGESAVATLLYG